MQVVAGPRRRWRRQERGRIRDGVLLVPRAVDVFL